MLPLGDLATEFFSYLVHGRTKEKMSKKKTNYTLLKLLLKTKRDIYSGFASTGKMEKPSKPTFQ